MWTPTKIGGSGMVAALVATVLYASPLLAQHGSDTAFESMQQRGKQTMGVDQTTSSHGFMSLTDGGRIVLVSNVYDSAGVARIREHLRQLKRAFGDGDFSMPMFIHMKTVPGVSVDGGATRSNHVHGIGSPGWGSASHNHHRFRRAQRHSSVPRISADRTPRGCRSVILRLRLAFASISSDGRRRIIACAQRMDIDFVANNPGRTLFHCHQQLHMDFGFMALCDYV